MSESQSGAAPFGVRLDAATLTRLDAYAERIGRKRGGAAVRVIAAGLDALDGLPVAAPSPPSGSPPVLDADALADALAARLAGRLAAAVADRMPTTRAGTGLPVEPIRAVLAELRAGRVRGAQAGARIGKGEEASVLDGVVLAAIADLARLIGEGDDDDATPTGRIVGGPPTGRERRTGAPDPRGEDAPGRRFADALREARTARGMSQEAAAAAAGVGLSTLQRAEWGKSVRDESMIRLRTWAGL